MPYAIKGENDEFIGIAGADLLDEPAELRLIETSDLRVGALITDSVSYDV